MFRSFTCQYLLLAALAVSASAAEFHVSPQGRDTNAGTAAKPFATLEKARNAARAAKGDRHKVLLHGGTYHLEKTLELSPADSGLVIQAAGKETPVLSGGRAINGWRSLTEEPA